MIARARIIPTVSLLALLLASSTRGQVPLDHLKCFAIRDTQPKATYTADLDGLVAQPGCVIKVPAKVACVPTHKIPANPSPPPVGANSGPVPTVLCYKVKCPRAVIAPQKLADQFGSRPVSFLKTSLLCATATTTTTTTVPPSTSVTSTTTTTSCPTTTAAEAPCFPGSGGPCVRDCPPGQTCADAGGGTCGCVGPPSPCGGITGSQLCGLGACPTGMQCVSAYHLPACSDGCECR